MPPVNLPYDLHHQWLTMTFSTFPVGLHLIDIGDLPESFWSQVGRNTNYFYHPDETVADNFVIMVRPSTRVFLGLGSGDLAMQIHPDDQIPVTPVITQKLARIFGRDNLWNAD